MKPAQKARHHQEQVDQRRDSTSDSRNSREPRRSGLPCHLAAQKLRIVNLPEVGSFLDGRLRSEMQEFGVAHLLKSFKGHREFVAHAAILPRPAGRQTPRLAGNSGGHQERPGVSSPGHTLKPHYPTAVDVRLTAVDVSSTRVNLFGTRSA